MSTDLPNPASRVDQRQRLQFRRFTLGFILILVASASGLGVINATQGPRISSIEMNQEALITRPGQRVLIHTNQRLAPITPDQLKISPSTDVEEITVNQNTITVRFAAILDYSTNYTVSVHARGAFTGIDAKLHFTFSTSDTDVFSLQRDTRQDSRGNDRPDQILRTSISGTTPSEKVFEAPRIQEYVPLQNLFAVVTLDKNNTPSLILTSPSDGVQVPVDVRGANTIRELHATSRGDLFGYILDRGSQAGEPRSSLFLYDLTTGEGKPTPVTGFSGNSLPVIDWAFVPGTNSLVAQGEDGQIYLIDPLTNSNPTPVGQHVEMRGFIPGTAQLIVVDPVGKSIIDLETGTTKPLNLTELQVPANLYQAKVLPLSQASYIGQYTEIKPGMSSKDATSVLILSEPTGSRELYRTSSPGSRIRDYCLSPNGQYLAVEVISQEGVLDNYPVVYGYSASSIIFVPLTMSASTRSINGFLPDWCE